MADEGEQPPTKRAKPASEDAEAKATGTDAGDTASRNSEDEKGGSGATAVDQVQAEEGDGAKTDDKAAAEADGGEAEKAGSSSDKSEVSVCQPYAPRELPPLHD